MAKGQRYLIAFLVIIALFSSVKYIQLREEKRQLLRDVEQIWSKISDLENEKDELAQELEKRGLVDVFLGLAKEKVSEVDQRLIEAKETIIQLQLSMAELKGEKEKLNVEAKRLRDEKAWLEKRFHSVRELKQAIRAIKREMYLVKSDMSKRIEMLSAADGNCGYLVKDGKSTYKRKVKISVIPVTEK